MGNVSRLPKLTSGAAVGADRPIQFQVNVLPPITSAGRVKVQGSSILMQNTGDDEAYINRGFTIPVGASFAIETGQDWNYISDNILITFEGVGANPRIEIMELGADIEGYGDIINR